MSRRSLTGPRRRSKASKPPSESDSDEEPAPGVSVYNQVDAPSSDESGDDTPAMLDEGPQADYSYLSAVPQLDDLIEPPKIIAPRLDRDQWGEEDELDKFVKAALRGEPDAEEDKPPVHASLPQPGISVADVERKNEETTVDPATGITMATAATNKKHVVFGGKAYAVEESQDVKDVVGSGSASKAQKRQLRLRFDRSPVVLKERTRALATAIGLKDKHLRRLRACFARVDFDAMGDVSYTEFFEWVDEPRSPFTDLIYDNIIERAGGQTMTFDDFICVCGIYCMYSRDEILQILFQMFDQDSSGAIDEGEFEDLCRMVNNGKPTFPGSFQVALENFDVDGDGEISYPEFVRMNDRFPLVLFPAFRLQDAIQRHTLGGYEWAKLRAALNQQRLAAKHAEDPTFGVKKKEAPSLLKLLFIVATSCISCGTCARKPKAPPLSAEEALAAHDAEMDAKANEALEQQRKEMERKRSKRAVMPVDTSKATYGVGGRVSSKRQSSEASLGAGTGVGRGAGAGAGAGASRSTRPSPAASARSFRSGKLASQSRSTASIRSAGSRSGQLAPRRMPWGRDAARARKQAQQEEDRPTTFNAMMESLQTRRPPPSTEPLVIRGSPSALPPPPRSPVRARRRVARK